MNIHMQRIEEKFKDLDKIKAINDEAFPSNERISIEQLLDATQYLHIDIFAIYDQTIIVGFCVIFFTPKTAHIFFMAIAKNHQSKGYGSSTLKLIKQQYPNHQITLVIEEIDHSAINNSQRLKRKSFYLNNAFRETDYYVNYANMTFEILVANKAFDKIDLFNLLDKIKHKISEWTMTEFEPVIYTK